MKGIVGEIGFIFCLTIASVTLCGDIAIASRLVMKPLSLQDLLHEGPEAANRNGGVAGAPRHFSGYFQVSLRLIVSVCTFTC